MSTVDLSERDNKETLFVKEEVTDVFCFLYRDVCLSGRSNGGGMGLLRYDRCSISDMITLIIENLEKLVVVIVV